MIKLNVGASPIWYSEGWHTLDHKTRENTKLTIAGDAADIPLDENTCATIFCSHMFEHIPHVKLEAILLEFNRVLENDGILRILTPDLKKVAKAYVEEDKDFFLKAKSEDESLRTDLGLGGMFMNFIVSPGQDTALYNRSLNEFIAGYAHLYSYDFNMLKILLERTGFYLAQQKEFCVSDLEDYRIPMHVVGKDPEWRDLNQDYYKENGLVHYYDTKKGKYIINFKITGFDRDPLTSLIIEARKKTTIDKNNYSSLNESNLNYNRYAWSLLRDKEFSRRNDLVLNTIKETFKD
tara:strand:+ start:1659 stop:2537 length:879 start_codon:yes stop_codon:yes gene_type:complete